MRAVRPDIKSIHDFFDVFDREFDRLLGHRAATSRAAYVELLAHARGPIVIVETGCVRAPGNWAGDGQSTIILDHLAAAMSGRVWSVDISSEAVAVASSLTSENVSVICGDSVEFLSRFDHPIDFLYLDSLDLDANSPLVAAHHHLFELCAASRNLRAGSIVMVDDTWQLHGRPFGKGMLIAEYMDKIGAELICEGYQSAWLMR